MSAKEDINVRQAFVHLAKEIKEKILSDDQILSTKTLTKGVKMVRESDLKQNKNKGCC